MLWAMAQATAGISPNCRATPSSTSGQRPAARAKSAGRRVSPMPNMMITSSGTIAPENGVNSGGAR